MMRKVLGNVALVLISILFALAGGEVATQVGAYHLMNRGKLFETEKTLGWRHRPDLDIVRENVDGEPWRVVTDELGLRSATTWPESDQQRALVVGDSFAFGQGVDRDVRFDEVLVKSLDLAVVNIGVMGYGTDQQVIGARGWTDQLRTGDLFLMLTYSNDFFDLVRRRNYGKSKPWFEVVEDDGLVEHSADIDWFDHLHNNSFLVARIIRLFADRPQEGIEDRLPAAADLYPRIIESELPALMSRGVVVVIVHHGDSVFPMPFDIDDVFAEACALVSSCLALDPVLEIHRTELFLKDRHWNAAGHEIAGRLIAAHLRRSGFAINKAVESN